MSRKSSGSAASAASIALGVAHVEHRRVDLLRAQLVDQRVEPLLAPPGGNAAPAARDQRAHRGLADPGGGAGYESGSLG